jgi:hypothetical protein
MPEVKRSGRVCSVCGELGPNESFRGRSRALHRCRECCDLPEAELLLRRSLTFLHEVLDHPRISLKNLTVAAELARSEEPEIRALAELVCEVARIHPRRKSRLKSLRVRYPSLASRLSEVWDDPDDHPYDWDETDDFELDEFDAGLDDAGLDEAAF